MKHKLLSITLASAILLEGISTLSGCSDDDSSSSSNEKATVTHKKKTSSQTSKDTNSNSDSTSSSDSKEDKVPSEYDNALESAKDYNEDQPMSKAGLLDQLTSKDGEGFTQEAGEYAVNHLNANWNENALKCAKDYLKEEHMSRSDLQEQLGSSVDDGGEGFTQDQVQYALSHLNN